MNNEIQNNDLQNQKFNDVVKLSNKNNCKSVMQYLELTKIIQDKWEDSCIWYRGQASITYKLIPSIYRESLWEYDSDYASNIGNEFINKAKQQFKFSNTASFWEWYHLMQHYGLPTRLLDWTEGSLIGLFFAVREAKTNENACVWMMDPFEFNLQSTGDKSVFYTDKICQDKDDLIIEKYKNDDKELPKLPIAIYPPYIDERMRTQKSCFTIHGLVRDGINEVLTQKGNFKNAKIIIDRNYLHDIRQELFDIGITEGTLFPDLEGLARELKFTYNMI